MLDSNYVVKMYENSAKLYFIDTNSFFYEICLRDVTEHL